MILFKCYFKQARYEGFPWKGVFFVNARVRAHKCAHHLKKKIKISIYRIEFYLYKKFHQNIWRINVVIKVFLNITIFQQEKTRAHARSIKYFLN